MSNVIIIVILSIMILLGIKETVKHFKGEGVCCGGASVKPKKKKLKNKVLTLTVFAFIFAWMLHVAGAESFVQGLLLSYL